MDSLDEDCTPLKVKYDECFNAWFRDGFLKGKAEINHDQACGELFKSYQTCLQVIKSLPAKIMCFQHIITFPLMQKAFGKHKVPEKEVYTDVLGTEREKIPTPPKSKSRT